MRLPFNDLYKGNEFIEWVGEGKRFLPTKLGKAVVGSSLSPDEGLLVFEELQNARRLFNSAHVSVV